MHLIDEEAETQNDERLTRFHSLEEVEMHFPQVFPSLNLSFMQPLCVPPTRGPTKLRESLGLRSGSPRFELHPHPSWAA